MTEPKEIKKEKKPFVNNLFYYKPEFIGNNLLHTWFKDQKEVVLVLNTELKGKTSTYQGTLLAMSTYEIVLRENSNSGEEFVRVIYKHDISSIRLADEDKK